MTRNKKAKVLTQDEFRKLVSTCKTTKEIADEMGIVSTSAVNRRLRMLPAAEIKKIREAGRNSARYKNIPLEELQQIMENAESWSQILLDLGYQPTAGNVARRLRKHCQNVGIDYSHIPCGANWFLQSIPTQRRKRKAQKLLDKLKKDTHHSSSWLKHRLIKEGFLVPKCSDCGILELAVLTLDHINGDHQDNRLENLRILCANCHMKTETFGSRNKAYLTNKEIKEREEHEIKKNLETTCVCGARIWKDSIACITCTGKKRRTVDRPSLIELLTDVAKSSYVAVGLKYGVSDNAIRKWIQNYIKNPVPLVNKIPVNITLKEGNDTKPSHLNDRESEIDKKTNPSENYEFDDSESSLSDDDNELDDSSESDYSETDDDNEAYDSELSNKIPLKEVKLPITDLTTLHKRIDFLESIIRKFLPKIQID